MNAITLTGRLCHNPSTRFTQSGKAVASFTLAVNEGYGEKQTVQFIPIVCWQKLAELVGNSIGKGSKILISGRLSIRDYESTDGTKRKIAEVIANELEFLDQKKKDDNHNPFGGVEIDEEIIF